MYFLSEYISFYLANHVKGEGISSLALKDGMNVHASRTQLSTAVLLQGNRRHCRSMSLDKVSTDVYAASSQRSDYKYAC